MDNTSLNNKNNSFQPNLVSGMTGDFYHVTRLIETYCLPFICVFGILGNTLATITFLQKPLRQTSCSVYLVARSLSDNGFLLMLLVIWIGGVMDHELNKVQIICKILLFLTYICGCVSVWLVVLVTTENYIRICHPFVVKQWCTTRNAVISIVFLISLVLSLNHFPLWISDKTCTPCPQFANITQAFIYIDTIITLALPTILMAFLIISILIRLFQHHSMASKFSETLKRSKSKSKAHMAQVPKMLLAVSLTFLILNLPSHVIRLRLLIGSFMKGSLYAPDIEAAIQILSQLFYYSSLSLNILIYIGFGSNFRKTFKQVFKINTGESMAIDQIEVRHLNMPKTKSEYDSSENGLLSTPMLTADMLMLKSTSTLK